MILWLLRLFPQFAALEAQIGEASAARIAAEDRVREYRARCDSAETLRDEALKDRERNHKMMANWMALYYGSPSVPYPEVYVSPQREEPQAVRQQPQKRHASDLVREFEREFNREFTEQVDREYDGFNQQS